MQFTPGFTVTRDGKGKKAIIEVLCAACGDRIVTAEAKDEERALALAEDSRKRMACCRCSILAIVADALDDGHGTPDDEMPAAVQVVDALAAGGWKLKRDPWDR
jgi:hypothetical protein